MIYNSPAQTSSDFEEATEVNRLMPSDEGHFAK